jgi:hypothetical protein
MRTRCPALFRRAVPALFLVVGLGAGPLLAACSGGGPVGPSAASATTTATGAGPGSPTSAQPSPPAVPTGLVALWPFTAPDQVLTWQAAYRSAGDQPWHLDVGRTAIAFAHDHLGYTDVDRVTSRAVDGADARIGVGAAGEDGRDHAIGVLHLVRFGVERDAPWVVVGSEDRDLTLTSPRYGAAVTSPFTVGGRITGVDESLRVVVLGPASATPLAVVGGLPAGGQDTPWTTTVRFDARSGSVLVVAVSTGGHLMTVERFAITAVRVA